MFVACASSGTAGTTVLASPDGITWTARAGSAAGYIAVCWSPELGIFVIKTGSGSSVHISTPVAPAPMSTLITHPTFASMSNNTMLVRTLVTSNLTVNSNLNVLQGAVGIGKSNPAYKLDVVGDIYASGNVVAYSDIRQKENIINIDSALDKVLHLRGCTYSKIGDESHKKYVGVIAQELQEVLPEAVSSDQDGMLSVAYGNITALLIQAIKELSARVDDIAAHVPQLYGHSNV